MAEEPAFTDDDLREMVIRLAHEIRNPLAVIKSSVQLMQRIARPEGDTETCMHAILAQVERIDATVRGLQRYVKLGGGQAVDVEVAGAVQEAAARQREIASKAQVGLTVTGVDRLVARVDVANLVTALEELVGNAIRFSPAGTTVTVSWQANGGNIEIHVDDQCPGIGPEVAERIGRPFFSTSTQGTGLGLPIVQKVTRLYGGTLTWANRPGGGCRFTIALPRR